MTLDFSGRVAIVTGAGTGTYDMAAEGGVFSELQVGSYVFMDHDYNVCDLRGLDKPTFEQALQIDARVVSANKPGMVTVDAGLKAMATEKGPPMILKGAVEGSTTRFMSRRWFAHRISPTSALAKLRGSRLQPIIARSSGRSMALLLPFRRML